jgi:hypothetical protein
MSSDFRPTTFSTQPQVWRLQDKALHNARRGAAAAGQATTAAATSTTATASPPLGRSLRTVASASACPPQPPRHTFRKPVLTKALSLVVTLCSETTPIACVHRCRISSLNNLDRPLGLVGKIFSLWSGSTVRLTFGPHFPLGHS